MSGHTHGSTTPTLAPADRRRARGVFLAVLLPALAATVLGGWLLWPHAGLPTIPSRAQGETYGVATVTGVDRTLPATSQDAQLTATLDGSSITVYSPPEYVSSIHPGDRIQIVHVAQAAPGMTPYMFVDFHRGPPLALLAALFVVLVVAVARWRGFAALLGLGFSLLVIASFTLPALVRGESGAWVGLVSAAAIMFVVLYLAHGFSLRTSTALLGTLVGLVATTAIASWASGAAHLTGLSDEFALDLMSYAPQVRIQQVLLCGMVIAGLGVLNDVTITQASAVWELRASAPHAPRRRLWSQGMRIGRDHIASTVYTIVFAYVGATLPLVLLVAMSDQALLSTLGSGEIAEEVARTLVGSIGLVLAIPLTTALAVLVLGPARVQRPDGAPGTGPAGTRDTAGAGGPEPAVAVP
ncbi:MAG: YibE/F family protein [Actinobacteria bacterium]|nr:YibE/F family protein [Actinomycetota bacterium]MCG2803526.1 YibE/F family protein [Cellulomonas sp.]